MLVWLDIQKLYDYWQTLSRETNSLMATTGRRPSSFIDVWSGGQIEFCQLDDQNLDGFRQFGCS